MPGTAEVPLKYGHYEHISMVLALGGSSLIFKKNKNLYILDEICVSRLGLLHTLLSFMFCVCFFVQNRPGNVGSGIPAI